MSLIPAESLTCLLHGPWNSCSSIGFSHPKHGMAEPVKVLVAQFCLTLCDPMDRNRPGSSVHGILQARILEWVFPSPGDLPNVAMSHVHTFKSIMKITCADGTQSQKKKAKGSSLVSIETHLKGFIGGSVCITAFRGTVTLSVLSFCELSF